MEKEAKHVCSALDVRSKSNTQLVLESINLTVSQLALFFARDFLQRPQQ